jgi:hypothetical protein
MGLRGQGGRVSSPPRHRSSFTHAGILCGAGAGELRGVEQSGKPPFHFASVAHRCASVAQRRLHGPTRSCSAPPAHGREAAAWHVAAAVHQLLNGCRVLIPPSRRHHSPPWPPRQTHTSCDGATPPPRHPYLPPPLGQRGRR